MTTEHKPTSYSLIEQLNMVATAVAIGALAGYASAWGPDHAMGRLGQAVLSAIDRQGEAETDPSSPDAPRMPMAEWLLGVLRGWMKETNAP